MAKKRKKKRGPKEGYLRIKGPWFKAIKRIFEKEPPEGKEWPNTPPGHQDDDNIKKD